MTIIDIEMSWRQYGAAIDMPDMIVRPARSRRIPCQTTLQPPEGMIVRNE
jgi:hypothetical protein